jgi:hypothetical protein
MTDPGSGGDLIARLAAHKAIGNAPRAELDWLVAHGTLERYQENDMIARKGQPVEAMYIILSGHAAHMLDQAGAWRKPGTRPACSPTPGWPPRRGTR